MACDEGVLPLDERVADDEAELDDIYETERRLRGLHTGAGASAAHGRASRIRISGGLHVISGAQGGLLLSRLESQSLAAFPRWVESFRSARKRL